MKQLPLIIYLIIFLTACQSKTTSNFPAFAFIADDRFIIMAPVVDSSWATGASVISHNDSTYAWSTIRNIRPDSLPVQYRALMNSTIRIFAKNGESYLAKITGFKLYTTLIPHFGQVQEWDDQHTPDRDIALTINTTAAPYLVAEFDLKQQGLCFAIPSDKALPATYTRQDQDTTYKTILNNTLYTSAAFTKIQQSYDSTAEVPGTKWWEAETEQRWMTFSQKNVTQIITAGYMAGSPCADLFYVNRLFIWKKNTAAMPELIGTLSADYTPQMAVDMDHDGIPELLADKGFGTYAFLQYQGGEWIEVYTWTIPYFDCPC